ncbi:hypothetical protein FOL47_009273 [Perkinsus chesapeaki]|uniref:Uncharacterized protein n=1 Tax=Perkinsus chesapeaki TaxID=330153 RepID=A0A7J6L988_PERCH|nr:hypothetical protein FOL47_009273 [Perkinsus chesapeaki]
MEGMHRCVYVAKAQCYVISLTVESEETGLKGITLEISSRELMQWFINSRVYVMEISEINPATLSAEPTGAAGNAGQGAAGNAGQDAAGNAGQGAAGNAMQDPHNGGLAGVNNDAAVPNVGQLPIGGAGHGANQLAGNENNVQPPHGANFNDGGNDDNGGGDNVKDED